LTPQLPAALGRFCSADRADQIAHDLRSRLADTSAALALERTIERVRNCGFFDRGMGSQINLGFTKLK